MKARPEAFILGHVSKAIGTESYEALRPVYLVYFIEAAFSAALPAEMPERAA